MSNRPFLTPVVLDRGTQASLGIALTKGQIKVPRKAGLFPHFAGLYLRVRWNDVVTTSMFLLNELYQLWFTTIRIGIDGGTVNIINTRTPAIIKLLHYLYKGDVGDVALATGVHDDDAIPMPFTFNTTLDRGDSLYVIDVDRFESIDIPLNFAGANAGAKYALTNCTWELYADVAYLPARMAGTVRCWRERGETEAQKLRVEMSDDERVHLLVNMNPQAITPGVVENLYAGGLSLETSNGAGYSNIDGRELAGKFLDQLMGGARTGNSGLVLAGTMQPIIFPRQRITLDAMDGIRPMIRVERIVANNPALTAGYALVAGERTPIL